MEQQQNKTVPDTTYIDQAIVAWLAEKESISGSAQTCRSYYGTIQAFRARLQTKGRDLDLDLWAERADRPAWRRAAAELRTEIQDFASHSISTKRPRRRISDNAYKTRLIALSSFYLFAIGEYFDEYSNPVARIKRPKGRAFEKSRALPVDRVAAAIRNIDITTKAGMRDYTLFMVAFETSRRATELLGLRWRHVQLLGDGDAAGAHLTLTFERCKGGKMLCHTLSSATSQTLLRCMEQCYEMSLLSIDPSRPLWPSFSPATLMRPLSYSGLRSVCQERLGTTRVHELRHTAAHLWEQLDMPLRVIQELLGHSDIGTTMRYLSRMRHGGENQVASALATQLGFVSDEGSVDML